MCGVAGGEMGIRKYLWAGMDDTAQHNQVSVRSAE